MAVSSDLKFVLLEILPTPELMAQGRELRIQNHREMVHDCIWALNAVIIDAQIRALKEPEVEEWVNDVGIAVADVEDLLRSILSWQPRGAAASNLLPCSFPNVDGVASRHAILLELEEKARRLNYLVRRGSSLCLRKEMMDSTYPRREDEEAKKEYFTILREEVVGRDEDVEKVINKIRWKRQQRSHNVHDDDDDDDDDDGPLFFILFGNYMVGKTSVARLVYHHPWVSKHFDRRVWIDGSKVSSFDAMWVIKEFMRSIAGEPCEDVWLFYDRFGGSHRYLIILDDFFIGLDEQDKFFQLEYFFLLMGEPGSLVMLIGDYNLDDIFFLRSRHGFLRQSVNTISEDNWVKLFMRHALSHPDQAGVVEEWMLVSFARRLHRYFSLYPLYAKMLGLIFRYTETSRWQEEIDALCRTEQIEYNQHLNLMFLYYLSPIFARQCLYQLLIPHDYISGHVDLLHVLAAEGIPRKEKTKPTTSIELMKKMTKSTIKLISNALERCCFRMRVGRDSTISQQCIHLHLLVDSRASAFPTTLSAKVNNKLRTLSLHREEEMVLKQQPCQITGIPAAMFANLIHLRILHLGATRIQRLPHTVGKLLNLRYLNLSMSEIQVLPISFCNLGNLRVLNLSWCEKLLKLPGQIHNLRSLRIMKLAFCARLHRLPKSITSLVNLQELDLEGCHGLVELPEDFGNLRKLTNLNMIKCASLTQMPSGLEQMHNLQKLSGYSIRKVGRIEDVISELQPLIVLEELDIWNLQVVSNPTDALTPPMLLQDKLPKLKRLALHWKWYNVDDVEIASDVISLQVLEGLQPNIYLSKLEITSYVGKEFPRWIKEANLFSYNLEEIRLVNLRRCERLPPLGHLPYIRILEISGMDLITVVNETFYTPDTLTSISLDKLIFSEMPRLEKWAEPREGNAEWVIKELTLIQCPKLRTWETDVGVRKLNIWLNNEMLWHCRSVGWQRLIEGIHELTIVGCQELMCLPPVLRSIPWFWELTIIRCNKLISIPDWLVEKEFLKSLFISGCPELSYIPPKLKRRSDLRLQHSGCPKLRF
ncbi:unnamed protein product [Musa acuminata var. zebrina]